VPRKPTSLAGATRDRQSITAAWRPVGRRDIDGVRMIEIVSVPKRHGALTEIFRADWLDGAVVDQIFQVSLTPGAVSAWHVHEHTVDRLFVATGSITLALFDARESSPTHAAVQELFLTIGRPQLVVIPPGVWHGLVVTGTAPAIVLNAPDRAYDYQSPDHWRLPPDTDQIPYRFAGPRDSLS
jgi:dTDP-4-dehydrorhamnose 3,5-epimerase